jgi:tetratricopeptide (TPR) repeat protein
MSLDTTAASAEPTAFEQQLPQYYRSILREFKGIAGYFISFNLLFASLFIIEAAVILFLLPLHGKTLLLAGTVALFVLTLFTYFVLHFYYAAKKPEQISQLRDRFIASCRQAIGRPDGESEHHLTVASALSKIASYLQDFEWTFYRIPPLLQPLERWICRFSAYFYWEDVFKMKLCLLHAAVEEHLKQVRLTPTDLEVHASLAHTYLLLARLYQEPSELPPEHPRYGQTQEGQYEEHSRRCATLAIEEFRILHAYAPGDPWVHEQLALTFRSLKQPADEIRELEALAKLRPQDPEILFRLGTLYFSQGLNARGLQIYEQLKTAHFSKASDLVASYGRIYTEIS